MIQRALYKQIRQDIQEGKKIILLLGARQTGKTTLLETILSEMEYSVVQINGDEAKYHQAFSQRDLSKMSDVIGTADLLFIDEAQRIDDIGINMKILHDHRPKLRVALTGSSALDLANKLQEPMTGRKKTYTLYPIAIQELLHSESRLDIQNNLEKYLLFGLYPEILSISGLENKKRHLLELTTDYLYKDVLALSSIRHSDKLYKLLQLLALQVGSTVSINKLSNALDLSNDTINTYIDLLEKSFVIFRLSGFSKNLHKEISKMDKIYFYDTGIRNALLGNFAPMALRHDTGAIWENFLLSERLKKNSYANRFTKMFFWRVYTGGEIDLIEQSDGQLNSFEIKLGNKQSKPPRSWTETYPEATYETIHRDNWIDWVRWN